MGKPDTELGAEEHEPDNAQDQDGKTGGNGEQRKHRRSGLGLPRLGRGFNNLTLSLRCHDSLGLTFRLGRCLARHFGSEARATNLPQQ